MVGMCACSDSYVLCGAFDYSTMHISPITCALQATWKNLREAAATMALRHRLSLADCRLMAAVCPELVSVRQHHRWGGTGQGATCVAGAGRGAQMGSMQGGLRHVTLLAWLGRLFGASLPLRRIEPRVYGDSWRQQVSSPQKVRAAVAAAAAAEAAAGGAEPLPNPMHLRTDGAGTVLEGAALLDGAAGSNAAGNSAAGSMAAGSSAAAAVEEDTHVVDVVDPGRWACICYCIHLAGPLSTCACH